MLSLKTLIENISDIFKLGYSCILPVWFLVTISNFHWERLATVYVSTSICCTFYLPKYISSSIMYVLPCPRTAFITSNCESNKRTFLNLKNTPSRYFTFYYATEIKLQGVHSLSFMESIIVIDI